jgi:hypothetical protein
VAARAKAVMATIISRATHDVPMRKGDAHNSGRFSPET